jgi:hypothetical protein
VPATAQYRIFSNPILSNNIVWKNRAFNYAVDTTTNAAKLMPELVQTYNGECIENDDAYWDLGILGDSSRIPPSGNVHLNPTYSILTHTDGYSASSLHNSANDPLLTRQYCNGARSTLGISEVTTLPGLPPTINPVPALDEGGNWIDVRFGPLSLTDPANPTVVLGDYHIGAASSALNAGNTANSSNHDFDGQARPIGCGYEIGADEIVGGDCAPVASVSPTSITFLSAQRVGTTSGGVGQQVTVRNTGTAPLVINSLTWSADYIQGTATATPCNVGTSLAPNTTCTVRTRFQPTQRGLRSGTLTIGTNDPSSPTLTVNLSGTGIAPIASVDPTSLSFTSTSNAFTAAQYVTVSNTGDAPLGIGPMSFTTPGTAPSDFSRYSVTGLQDNCTSTVAAGASCRIYVRFRTLTAGTFTGTLVINNNDPANPPMSVSLTGTR